MCQRELFEQVNDGYRFQAACPALGAEEGAVVSLDRTETCRP